MVLFEYMYRDAGNFKAFGQVGLTGTLSSEELDSLRVCFTGDGLFIAEQLEIPPLYEALYQWSDGPTSSDHCWHEFVGVTEIDEAALRIETPVCGDVKAFLHRVSSIVKWDEKLSPYFWLGG